MINDIEGMGQHIYGLERQIEELDILLRSKCDENASLINRIN
jgi:hypothetical protein